MFMLPPTYFTCLEVAQHATPAEVLAAAEERSVEMFTPSVERDGEVDYLSMPDGVRALLAARTSRS
jgi:hypothetical protein